MATLTVFKFPDATGAERALDRVKSLQKQKLINLQDAAIVTWPEGKKKPETHHLVNMAGVGALDGAFWGMLFGLIFFVPILGAAIGAGMGALTGQFANYGIDKEFIERIRSKVTHGTSAVFLLTSDAVRDKVADEFRGTNMELIASNLTQEQEQELMADFATREPVQG
jgi:uncharacterized membrane protein